MKDDEKRKLAEEIIDGMEQVMRIRGAVFREELEGLGVTLPQFHLMKMIKVHGPLTVTEAARLMLVSTPTASRMIGALCARGMLRRYGKAGDQRISHIDLTHRGLVVVGKVAEMQISLITELLEGVQGEELRSFASVMRRLVRLGDGRDSGVQRIE